MNEFGIARRWACLRRTCGSFAIVYRLAVHSRPGPFTSRRLANCTFSVAVVPGIVSGSIVRIENFIVVIDVTVALSIDIIRDANIIEVLLGMSAPNALNWGS